MRFFPIKTKEYRSRQRSKLTRDNINHLRLIKDSKTKSGSPYVRHFV